MSLVEVRSHGRVCVVTLRHEDKRGALSTVLERLAYELLSQTEDAREAAAAFAEKRR